MGSCANGGGYYHYSYSVDPLNLSISLSGGKETNQDSPSNGE